MQSQSTLLHSNPLAPNVELLRRHGWSVSIATGDYCVAWRGRDEVVFEWRGGEWQRLGGRGSGEAA